MATRSRIAIERKGGTVESIYCHSDGRPSDNGRILLENYGDRVKVEKLIKLGDISYLAKDVEPIDPTDHSFENPQKGVTVAYHRDRGEVRRTQYHDTKRSFIRGDVEEYGYLFTLEGEWLFVNGHKSASTREAIPLKSVVED